MRVLIRTVEHKSQPYDTQGEWQYYGVTPIVTELQIETSALGDWRMEQACAVHEYIEALLCKQDGVSAVDVCNFDKYYETIRGYVTSGSLDIKSIDLTRMNIEAELPADVYEAVHLRGLIWGCFCLPTIDSEPGADIHAPYHSQHAFADGIERLLIDRLGVTWADYEAKTDELEYP